MPYNKKSSFIGGMVGVVKSIGKRVSENCRGFFKWNFVFGKIARCFIFVPIKPHN